EQKKPEAKQPTVATPESAPASQVQAATFTHTAVEALATQPKPERPAQPKLQTDGRVAVVNLGAGLVQLELDGEHASEFGRHVRVYRPQLTGRVYLGELEIVRGRSGVVTARPLG